MKKVIITKKEHPHFDEIGTVVEENVKFSISPHGDWDRIKNEKGEEFYALKSDYKLIFQRHR